MESSFGITETNILSNKNLNFLLRYIHSQNDLKLNIKSHRHFVLNFFLIDLWIILRLRNSYIPYLEIYLRLLLPYEAFVISQIALYINDNQGVALSYR